MFTLIRFKHIFKSALPSSRQLVAMFNFTKFSLYINMGVNLPEQQYTGFFQLRAEEVSLKGTEAEGF